VLDFTRQILTGNKEGEFTFQALFLLSLLSAIVASFVSQGARIELAAAVASGSVRELLRYVMMTQY
jgi:hypothetical protein